MLLHNMLPAENEVTMKMNPKTSQVIAKILIWASALFVIVILLAIIFFILIKGMPQISWQFLTEIPRNMGRSGGISSTIVGTLMVTAVAVIIATPSAWERFLPHGVYERGKITRIIRFSAESLSGIPSIVYGLFGFIFFVMYLKLGWSILSGGLTLAVMILQTIIRTSEEAIRTVSYQYREVSFSLGGTKWQTITKAVFPSAIRGIAVGVILGIGRCVAETAALSRQPERPFVCLYPSFHPPGQWRNITTYWP
jgi:phosphate transport system permease protein